MRGAKIKINCKNCTKIFEDYISNKRSNFCSLSCYWKAKKGTRGYWLGKKRSLEDRRKMSLNRIGLTAKEKHPKWKGGISSIFSAIRNSFEYKEWRRNVFRRDKWKCVSCGYRSKNQGDIQADHIKRFSEYPNLRFEITNGRTLCVPCHKKVTFYHA